MTDISTVPDDVDDFLAHYGILGMKWGKRKQRETSTKTSGASKDKKPLSRNQKLAIAGGIGAAVLGVAITGVILKNKGSMRFAELAAAPARKALEAPEPVLKNVLHASRGKNLGSRFLTDVGFDPLKEYGKAGFNGQSAKAFSRYGKNLEKVSATLMDPKGRKDFAGRPIYHDIMIPEDLAKGLNTIDDVKDKIWPMISDAYDKFYAESEKSRY